MLKTNEDITPHQSCEILQMFVWSHGRETFPQKAVNFSRNFAELYLFPLKTYHFQTWQFYQFRGVLFSSVNRFFPYCPVSKVEKTVKCSMRVSMGWWPLRLSAKILALLRLSVNFFQLRLTKKLKINFFCFKKLNIN